MTGYHVTTPAKLQRYADTGCILAPVRFWRSLPTAQAWAQRTGRTVILRIEADDTIAYPLSDHKPRMMAWWTNANIREWAQETS